MKKIRSVPDLSDASLAHLAAKESGDEHYRLWQRNVADHFKDKPEEQIKEILQRTCNPFAVCFEHWIGDFNMGTGIRNANAFNAKEVFYIGDKKWDRRSAVGVHNYTEVKWLPTIEDLIRLQNDYVIVGVDNLPGSVPLSSYSWPKNTLMVFGEEGAGLTPGMQAICKDMVYIEMFGSVRSFNCGTASGIAMYDFVTKHKQNTCQVF
jgi:tRNA G18 (ribose-2'-O)-methylase SpoU